MLSSFFCMKELSGAILDKAAFEAKDSRETWKGKQSELKTLLILKKKFIMEQKEKTLNLEELKE